MVSRILYLFPLSQVFRSSAWLLLNWFELYQKEKLRKKLPRGKMSGELYISPKERRAKAHQRQKELNRLSPHFLLAPPPSPKPFWPFPASSPCSTSATAASVGWEASVSPAPRTPTSSSATTSLHSACRSPPLSTWAQSPSRGSRWRSTDQQQGNGCSR